MATLTLKYVHEFQDRHGHWRRYYRRGGRRIVLPGEVGSDEFLAAYAAAKAEFAGAAPTKKAKPRDPRSVSALMALVRRSAEWRALAPSTVRTYDNVAKRIEAEYGDRSAATLPREAIKAIIADMADKPGAANNFLRIFRLMMRVAVDEGWRTDDPTATIRKIRYRKTGFQTWDEDAIAAFEARYALGTRERLAFALLLYTAQRRSDVVGMGWQHVRNGKIVLRQHKTGTELAIPIHRDLATVLAHTERDRLTFLLTSYGKPFVSAGFGNWFRDVCDAAGLPVLSAHGLRKAASRRLAEAGCTPHMIKAITGHKRLAEVDLYTERANRDALAEEAMRMIEAVPGTTGGNPRG